MRKLFLIIGFTIFLSFSCSESFLDKLPEDTLAPGTYFKTPEEIKTGITAIYKPLQTIFAVNRLPHMLGQMSGDGTRGYGFSEWHQFYKSNGNSASYLWSGFYKMIVDANDIITIIDNYEPKNDAESIVVSSYKGEATFLRGFAYFYLARLYGDLPKVVESFDDPSEAFGLGRTSVNQIYNEVVIPDFEYAFANCYKKGDPAINSEGARATKGAALTMLAKVYLTMNDHANAASTLKKLIVDNAAGNYALLSDFSQIWLPSNKFNSESIFEINYNVGAGTPSFYFRNIDINNGTNRYGMSTCNGQFAVEKNLMDEFAEYEDWTRFAASADSSGNASLAYLVPFPKKLMPDPEDNLPQYDRVGTDYNYMITRYADALLMYAEALMVLGQKDEAAKYVNVVRERANMAPISAGDLDIDRILHERRMELSFEGHRFFDLVRTGKAIEYISAILMSDNEYENRIWRTEPIPEYQLLLPIPADQIEIDQTLTQNTGY